VHEVKLGALSRKAAERLAREVLGEGAGVDEIMRRRVPVDTRG
jgi:hypothetical protein